MNLIDPYGLEVLPSDNAWRPVTHNCTCVSSCVDDPTALPGFFRSCCGLVAKIPGTPLGTGMACSKVAKPLDCSVTCWGDCAWAPGVPPLGSPLPQSPIPPQKYQVPPYQPPSSQGYKYPPTKYRPNPWQQKPQAPQAPYQWPPSS